MAVKDQYTWVHTFRSIWFEVVQKVNAFAKNKWLTLIKPGLKMQCFSLKQIPLKCSFPQTLISFPIIFKCYFLLFGTGHIEIDEVNFEFFEIKVMQIASRIFSKTLIAKCLILWIVFTFRRSIWKRSCTYRGSKSPPFYFTPNKNHKSQRQPWKLRFSETSFGSWGSMWDRPVRIM